MSAKTDAPTEREINALANGETNTPQLGKTDAPQTGESIQANPFKQKKNRQLALAVLGASWLPG